MKSYDLQGNPWYNSLAERDAIKRAAATITSAPLALYDPPVVNRNTLFALYPVVYTGAISLQDAGVLVANSAYSVYKINHSVAMCEGTTTTIGQDNAIVATTYVPVTVMGASAVSLSSPTSAVPYSLVFDADPYRIDVYSYYGMINHVHPTGYNSHDIVTAFLYYRGMYLPVRQIRICYS